MTSETQRLVAYAPSQPRAPVDLDLARNEGPRTTPAAERLRRYPDARTLERALAARFELAPEQVLVTAGADDALDRACRAFLGPRRALVMPVPGFEMLERYAALAGAELRGVPWRRGALPVDALAQAAREGAGMLALISPNNPTGAAATSEELARLAAALDGVPLVCDLAYAEFADLDLTRPALERGALVVRTFSKAWSLAGLRVGYAMGRAEDVARLRAAGAPFPVSAASLELAARALEGGAAAARAAVGRVRDERGRLFALCAELGLAPLPSQANFVSVSTRNGEWLRDALAGLGIGVRRFAADSTAADLTRIGLPGEERCFARLCDALRAAVRPRALLFDLDGVLADVSRSYRSAILATAASFGAPTSPERVRALKARGAANDDWAVTRELIAEAGLEVAYERVRARFEDVYQGAEGRPGLWREETPLVPRATLARWAARLPLGIVTGRPRADAERFLETFGLRELFACVVAREDAPLKPDPAGVRRALVELGVEAAWMLGDTPDDVRAARAAGVVPLGVLPPGAADAELERALFAAGAARVLDTTQRLDALLVEVLP